MIYPVQDPFSVEVPGILGPDKRKTYLVCGTLTDPGAPDFSPLEELDARYQEVGPDGAILEEKARKPGDLHPARVPNLSDRYGFSCFKDILSRLEDYDHLTFTEQNLEYTGKTRGLFRFRCARRDAFFLPSGCQGSPILDEDARIVSLLVGGDSSKRVYYGLDLWRFLSSSQFSRPSS